MNLYQPIYVRTFKPEVDVHCPHIYRNCIHMSSQGKMIRVYTGVLAYFVTMRVCVCVYVCMYLYDALLVNVDHA